MIKRPTAAINRFKTTVEVGLSNQGTKDLGERAFLEGLRDVIAWAEGLEAALKPFAAPPSFTLSIVGDGVVIDFGSRDEAEEAYEAIEKFPGLLP